MRGWVNGGSTQRALFLLGRAFDAVSSGRPTHRVVMLRGGTGTGRTGLLQAFYELTAQRQGDRMYWPPALAPEADPLARRDVIIPAEFTVSAGVRLPWLWWGLSGTDEVAAWTANEQTRRHTQAFSEALAALDGVVKKRIALATRSVFLVGGLLPVVGSVVQAIDFAVEAVDMAGDLTVFQNRRTGVEAALRTDRTRRFSMLEDAKTQIEVDARVLSELSRLVPLVIVVDDAEDLDPLTIALLNRLIRSSASRVLLVLAVDTDYHPTHPGEDTLTEADNVDLHAFAEPLHARGVLEVVDLHPFTDDELMLLTQDQLVAWAVFDGHTLDGTAEPGHKLQKEALRDIVAEADGSPGRVATLLSHRSIREALRRGGPLPDLDVLFLDEATEAAWAQLSLQQRTALAVLSLHGQRTLAHWVDPQTLATGTSTGWVTTTSTRDARDPDPVCSDRVLTFRNSPFYETAARHCNDQLTPAEIDTARNVLSDELLHLSRTDTWHEVPTEIATAVLLHLADTYENLPDQLVAASLRVARATERGTTEPAELETLISQRQPTGELLIATAEALADAGYQTRAIDLFADELDRLKTKYGTNDPRTLPSLHNLAAAWAAYATAQPPVQAVPAYETACALYTQLIRGYATHQVGQKLTKRLPDTRLELARLHHHFGRARLAVNAGAPAPAELAGLLNPEHLDTLRARQDLAVLRAQAGDTDDAVKALAELVPTQERVQGPEHPSTLITRRELAVWSGREGTAAGAAVHALAELLPIQERVLGPEHPHALRTRHEHAVWCGRAGDTDGAVKALAELLPIQEWVLGPEHPDTLRTRHEHAVRRAHAGDTDGAAKALAELLPIFDRVHGPEHPVTLTARTILASWGGAERDIAGAAKALAELLPIQERVLGPEHPHTLQTRFRLISMPGREGAAAGAVVQALAELLSIQERVLGPEHPHTLQTLHSLAYWRGRAGDAAGAVKALIELLPIQERVLGPEHPHTRQTRRSLHFWRGPG